jgi:hypothetical protein
MAMASYAAPISPLSSQKSAPQRRRVLGAGATSFRPTSPRVSARLSRLAYYRIICACIGHAAVLWLMESRAHWGGGWSWKTDAARGGGALSTIMDVRQGNRRVDCTTTAERRP